MDDHLRASMARTNGIPDSETGHYGKLIYAGCESKERANEIKRALFRSGRYVGCSVSATVKPAGNGTFNVEFVAISKVHARKYILEKHGTDRSKWPYDPRRPNGK